MNPPRFARVVGVVRAFDEAAGWGTVHTDTDQDLFFHCTQIADGSRSIRVGTRVEADVAPIGLGSWEATEVRELNRP